MGREAGRRDHDAGIILGNFHSAGQSKTENQDLTPCERADSLSGP